jgi:hypothetical protein
MLLYLVLRGFRLCCSPAQQKGAAAAGVSAKQEQAGVDLVMRQHHHHKLKNMLMLKARAPRISFDGTAMAEHTTT